jgi:hypothetical protein
VHGSGSGVPAHGANATLVVDAPLAPDYGLSAMPTPQTVVQGTAASYTVTLSPNATFAGGSVMVGASSAPADVSFSGCAAALTAASPSCTLTVSTTGASLASHALTITGTVSTGLPVRTAGATLVVSPPVTGDFALSITTPTRVVFTPATLTYTVTVAKQNGFAGAVALSVAGLPANWTYSISPPTTTSTATLTVNAVRGTGGTQTVHMVVTGTSGSLVHTVTATIGAI